MDPAEWDGEPSEWVADLAELRSSSRALRDADLALLDAKGAAIAYLRHDGDEAFVVVANAADNGLAWEVTLPVPASDASVVPIRGGAAGERSAALDGETLRIQVPGRDGMVIRLS